ncbi:MAG TPA: LPS export ABC transporter periplasmic protein LptC [Candidatus Limnocylindria bacterium]|jgi:LPS export ABC transporter protein LptC|nr:LPS export ABC transporter periplasmic protein LptC [Candidatus Limnocylindria bacterium]
MTPLRAVPLLLAAALAACGGRAPHASSPSPAPAAAAPSTPTAVPIRIVTQGGHGQYTDIVQSVKGRKVYTIRALSSSSERTSAGSGIVTLEQPHVTFIDKSGAATIADAPKAHLTERDNNVVMTGGVHATTSTGSVMTCDVLTYNGKTERLRGDGNVHLYGPNGLEMDGNHLDGDVRLQEVKITQ